MEALSKRLWDRSLDHGGKCAYHSGTRACRLSAWEIYKNSAIGTGLPIGGVGLGLGLPGAFKRHLCTLGPESLLVFIKKEGSWSLFQIDWIRTSGAREGPGAWVFIAFW